MAPHPGHGPGAQRHHSRPCPPPSAAGPRPELPGAHRGRHPLPRALPGKPASLVGCALLTFIPICKFLKKFQEQLTGILMCRFASCGLVPVGRPLHIRWPSGRESRLLASLPLVICFFSPQTFSFRKLPVVCTSKLPSEMGPRSPRVHALFSLSLGSNSALFDGCFPATDCYAFERENCPRIICLSQLLIQAPGSQQPLLLHVVSARASSRKSRVYFTSIAKSLGIFAANLCILLNEGSGLPLAVQQLKPSAPTAGAVGSILVRELESHIPHSTAQKMRGFCLSVFKDQLFQ